MASPADSNSPCGTPPPPHSPLPHLSVRPSSSGSAASSDGGHDGGPDGVPFSSSFPNEGISGAPTPRPRLATGGSEASDDGGDSSSYYAGSMQVAQRLHSLARMREREEMSGLQAKMLLALTGMPARGKSFIARKLHVFLNWSSVESAVFNVGKYRRDLAGAGASDFFDPSNQEAAVLRETAAMTALDDALAFLDGGGQAAIFDATNTTRERRKTIYDRVKAHDNRIGVVFIESVCTDQAVLDENLNVKVDNSPDFAGMSREEALRDLRKRIALYESVYETLSGAEDAYCYIKLYNLSSKVLANRCYGRITKTLLPLLMAVHIGARPIYLIRAGAAEGGSLALADSFKEKSVSKIAALNPEGRKFAAKLAEWLTAKVEDFITETKGRARAQSVVRLTDGRQHMGVKCKVMTSTLPRAAATAELIGESEQYTTLNPLDKGMLAHLSLKEISEHQKKFYRQWQKEPFRTRFPGGESYADVVSRLQPLLIEIEQQTAPVVVISHCSVLQALYSYFSGNPIKDCWKLSIPMHTVIELTPVIGGSWLEKRYKLE